MLNDPREVSIHRLLYIHLCDLHVIKCIYGTQIRFCFLCYNMIIIDLIMVTEIFRLDDTTGHGPLELGDSFLYGGWYSFHVGYNDWRLYRKHKGLDIYQNWVTFLISLKFGGFINYCVILRVININPKTLRHCNIEVYPLNATITLYNTNIQEHYKRVEKCSKN